MKRKVHIVSVGKDRENVITGVERIGCDVIYPICSEKFADEALFELKKRLINVKIHTTIHNNPIVIDPFTDDSFFSIVEIVGAISKKERDENTEIWVNITGGTNLMSAAIEAGAVLTGSTAYYVVKGENDKKSTIITIPWHSLLKVKINDKQRRILSTIDESEITDSEIMEKTKFRIPKSSLNFSLKKLEELNLIERRKTGRVVHNSLTPWGRLALQIG